LVSTVTMAQLLKNIDYKEWSSVLEESYLKFIWSFEAKKHSYVDRSNVEVKAVERVLISYKNSDSSVQRCRDKSFPETERVIIQQKFRNNDKLLLRVVINPTTDPWTIITFIPGSVRRYWDKDVF
jgi:hypothetical protein